MTRQLTAIIEREGDGYVALCPEVDVVSQGNTVSEARDNLEEALALFFETASAEEIEGRLRDEIYSSSRKKSVRRADLFKQLGDEHLSPGARGRERSLGIVWLDVPLPRRSSPAAPLGAPPTLQQESAPFYGADSYRFPSGSLTP